MDNIGVLPDDTERQALRDRRVIVISGEIDQESARAFVEDIMLLTYESNDPINVVIVSSPGGRMFDGLAIMNAIGYAQKMGIKVVGSVYGAAMSVTFFILQCCDVRVLGSMGVLMAHGASTEFFGDLRSIDSEQQLMAIWQKDLSTLAATRCTNKNTEHSTPEYWVRILKDNTPHFYSADESLDKGLVDEIDGNYKR